MIEQILSTLAALGCRFDPYFLRTSDGYEIDLLLEIGRERWAFEIKLTTQPDAQDLDGLNKIADLVRTKKRILVSQTRRPTFSERLASCGLSDLLEHMREVLEI